MFFVQTVSYPTGSKLLTSAPFGAGSNYPFTVIMELRTWAIYGATFPSLVQAGAELWLSRVWGRGESNGPHMKPKTLGVARGRPGCKCGRVRGTGWREPCSWCMGLNQYPPPLGLPQLESIAEDLIEPGGLLPIPSSFFPSGQLA